MIRIFVRCDDKESRRALPTRRRFPAHCLQKKLIKAAFPPYLLLLLKVGYILFIPCRKIVFPEQVFVPFKILVVEDNADSRNLLHFYFTSKGYNVITAVDGMEGLYLTKAEKPDAIITDLTMPNLDGVEMIRQIRSEPLTAQIPVVVYTAYGSELSDTAIQAGADHAFSKPFDLDEMIQFIGNLLEQSNTQ
jgi:CheY-like chemotaxis protein